MHNVAQANWAWSHLVEYIDIEHDAISKDMIKHFLRKKTSLENWRIHYLIYNLQYIYTKNTEPY